MPRVIEPRGGESIQHTIAQAIADANAHHDRVEFKFNGMKVVVSPGDKKESVYARWQRQREEESTAYRNSPEGKADAAREAKAAEAEKRREAQKRKKAERLGVLDFELLPPPFSPCLIDGIGNRKVADTQPWTRWVEANTDPYGRAAIVYAARWMIYMEKEISKGKSVAEAAKKTQHEADLEGISGAMQSAASSVVAECWLHGDEFKEWRWPDEQP